MFIVERLYVILFYGIFFFDLVVLWLFDVFGIEEVLYNSVNYYFGIYS